MTDHRLWPGKSRHSQPDGPAWHPATFHCLDVAAVAERILLDNPAWCARIARTAGATPEETKRLFVRAIALHDIGKLTRGFCEMLEYKPPVPANQPVTCLRHWEASYELLIGELNSPVEQLLGMPSMGARRQIYGAVAGHHGRPPTGSNGRFSDLDGLADAISFVNEVADLVPGEDVWSLRKPSAARLSWTLAGLTVLADWIGSNADWFPYVAASVPTADYWDMACRRAELAVASAGVTGSRVASSATLQSLFGIESPRPMQAAAAALQIDDEPMLVVIEDATGSGKTESAVLLAQRMMSSGLAEGAYVALPTTATANAMFGRLGDSYRALFDEGSRPSLALAHGSRKQNPRFAEAMAAGLRATEEAPDGGKVEDTDVAAFCAAWIADDRRKTFHAEVGVGTIDQAFLGVLPVKFASLRLVGLARRVLIVDEAHACDPYMEVELCRLLEMQAMLGGSAIVMTATLTLALRERLVEAYRAGLARDSKCFNPSAQYPSLTVARAVASDCDDLEVKPYIGTVRTLPVSRIDSVEKAVTLIVAAVRSGAAVAWVRNTVDDVIEGYDRLVEELKDVEECSVELFHARFAMADRLDVERRVLKRYGRDSQKEERSGRVLVASQVVESSLDLDFDVMVSDLASIDALIQRAGRLWRHVDQRPASQRPIAEPMLHVLSPDPDAVDDAGWGRSQFGGSGFVYGTDVLWRSARALFDAGEIDAPSGLRTLLEAVVGDTRPEVPVVLEHDENARLGETYASAARGRGNAVVPAEGYLRSAIQGTDLSFPTRADTDSCRVILVRALGDDFVTWIEDDPTTALSEIGLRTYRYEKLVEGGGFPAVSTLPGFAATWPAWRKESLRMLVVDDDGLIGTKARYDCVSGLHSVPRKRE